MASVERDEVSTARLWAGVEAAFSRLLDAWAAGKAVPLLEADVAGYLYYLLVSDTGGAARRIHLSTRLAGTDGKEKYDLVIGDILETEALKRLFIERAGDKIDEGLRKSILSRSVRSGFRPAVRGEIVLEFKHFAAGFDLQQLTVHAKQAMDDVRKLSELSRLCPEGRGAALFDETGFLQGPWLEKIVAARSADDSQLRLYLFEPDGRGQLAWRRL